MNIIKIRPAHFAAFTQHLVPIGTCVEWTDVIGQVYEAAFVGMATPADAIVIVDRVRYPHITQPAYVLPLESLRVQIVDACVDSSTESGSESSSSPRKPKQVHACPQCPYTFKSQWSLREHVDAVHLKLKPYKCPHCGYAAARQRMLRKHLTGTCCKQFIVNDNNNKL